MQSQHLIPSLSSSSQHSSLSSFDYLIDFTYLSLVFIFAYNNVIDFCFFRFISSNCSVLCLHSLFLLLTKRHCSTTTWFYYTDFNCFKLQSRPFFCIVLYVQVFLLCWPAYSYLIFMCVCLCFLGWTQIHEILLLIVYHDFLVTKLGV